MDVRLNDDTTEENQSVSSSIHVVLLTVREMTAICLKHLIVGRNGRNQ